MAQIDNAGLSRFRRWYSQYRATHGTTPPRNMVSSFMQGEIEASIARMDKARELGLRQESLNLQRQGMEYEKDISERRLSLTKEMYEKELGMKEKEIGKQDRAAKWSGIGTAVVAAPTAYKIGKAAYDWAIGSMAPESGMGTVMGGTVEGLEAGLPAIGTMSTPTIAATGTGGMMGAEIGTMGAGTSAGLGAATTMGAGTGAGTGTTAAAAAGGYAGPGATTGLGTMTPTAGIGAYAGPAAAVIAMIATAYSGHSNRRQRIHAKEDWFSQLPYEQKVAYKEWTNKQNRWSDAYSQLVPAARGSFGEVLDIPPGAVGVPEMPSWLTGKMVFQPRNVVQEYDEVAPQWGFGEGQYVGPNRVPRPFTPDQLKTYLHDRANWMEKPDVYQSVYGF